VEAAARPAADAGVRTVTLRSGMVLAGHGGALKRMLLPFRLGLGGRTGTGRQYMSWISLPDEVGAIEHALTDGAVAGPVNAVSPSPVTNAVFTSTLARVLRRPSVLPTRSWRCTPATGASCAGAAPGQPAGGAEQLRATGYRFLTPRSRGPCGRCWTARRDRRSARSAVGERESPRPAPGQGLAFGYAAGTRTRNLQIKSLLL